MPRNVGVSVENAFNKGLVTEVTGVNSPENSVVESVNFVYERTGRAVKRRGFTVEPGAVWEGIAVDDAVYHEYVWKTLFDNSDRDLVVVQVGTTLHFYESTGEDVVSASRKPFVVNLLVYKNAAFPDSVVANTPASFATGRGYLFVAHPNCEPFFVSYDSETDTIETKQIDIRIRDFRGVDDGLDVGTRPRTSLTVAHKYNLYNQGWYVNTLINGVTSSGNPLDAWGAARADWPSNGDVWWYYMGVEQSGLGREFFSTSTIIGNIGLYGNSPAPKGHYIINPFQTNRSQLSRITGVEEETSNGLRPSVIAFYAGRVFYAGVGKSGYASRIYFSQIIQDDSQLGKCYQANDPTSREVFDLLDTDGGVIEIQDVTTVYGMQVVGQILYVFAGNGIWAISGTDATPFKATNYSVSKVTSEATINRTSIVDVSGYPIWWNHEGIYTLRTSDAGLSTDVSSLTVGTIQSFYDEIPQTCKKYAKGSYNQESDLIYWLYSDDEFNPTNYSNILVLDAVSIAFYPLTLPPQPYKIRGVLPVRSSRVLSVQDQVVTNANDIVTTNSGDPVYVLDITGQIQVGLVFKFITTDGTRLTFAEISDGSYFDWGEYDYESYFITGYRIRGEILRKSQTNYLTVVTDSLNNAVGYMQGIWDYANHQDSGRYTNPQSIYRHKDFRDYQLTRLKVRGSGRSLQFKFYGSAGSPLSIVGWMGYESTNTNP